MEYYARGGPDRAARGARLPPRRLRLHDVHRQLRAAARGGLRRRQRGGPRGRLRAQRQPQLRGPDQPRREDELPRVAAARRRLRARRDDGHRPARRAARPGRATATTSSCTTSGRPRRRSAASSRRPCAPRCSRSPTARSSRAARSGTRSRCPRATASRGTTDSTYVRRPSFLEDVPREPRAARRHRGRARARAARRLGHHRPHLARRRDQEGLAGGALPQRARRRAGGLQLLRRAPRQPRGDDARHVREHPPAQPAGRARRPRRRAHAEAARGRA